MTPDVTRAAEEHVFSVSSVGDRAGNFIFCSDHLLNAFASGARWKSEQHREVLIRLKHLVEKAGVWLNSDHTSPPTARDQLKAALTLINKELAT